ncbi:membrane protein [Formosimonas limnophila]|uniref:Membrane protein n=2 Tax=Formosimonas limnophila TaxID=1384487 RepID=A0A8J3CNE0_9BURK|nr:membrane protein [Formosimonas limnophila]
MFLMKLSQFDVWLIHRAPETELSGFSRFFKEFWFFGLKNARACLFAGLFFLSMMFVPRTGVLGVPKYDVLLIIAVSIQAWMVWAKLETWDELKAITVFHLVGFALEAFKVSGSIGSWSYPLEGYTKLFGVPLFSGFMYAAVGSYIIQAWRLFDMRIRHHPSYWLATLAALMIYANFFTHHFIGDYRWYIGAFVLGLYSRTRVVFRPLDRDRWMPLLLGFILTGFFIWLAENIGTFLGVWQYPNQMGAWATVHIGKWSSWAMLVVMTFTIIVNLKHVKETIHVPE